MINRFFGFLVLAVFAGCARQPMPVRATWSGTLELPGGRAMPFRMELDLSGSKPSGYFINGDEKTPVPEISTNGNNLILTFSEYGAEMRGAWNGSQWTGNYIRRRSDGTKSLEFTASPEGSTSKESSTIAKAPVGNYQVSFTGEDKPDDSTVAKLWSKDGTVYGTFIAPDGDYGLLTGQAAGSGIQLNRFNGWQAMAIALEPNGETWNGKYYAASIDKPRTFVLQPRADSNVEAPADKRTAIKNPDSGFSFSGVSLSGETVRNTDDRFKGKALIVDIMGTWCHNCLDEAPILQQLQQQYGKNGLEIVGLSFEISDDPAAAKKNIQLFRDRFGLTYTLLFCGSLDDNNVKKQLHSQLDNFFAYPTTIFIDSRHQVKSIHSGFKGPGTGEEFQKQIQEFQQRTTALLN
jgi:thiol-disulfide isomerase/thioredoxin